MAEPTTFMLSMLWLRSTALSRCSGQVTCVTCVAERAGPLPGSLQAAGAPEACRAGLGSPLDGFARRQPESRCSIATKAVQARLRALLPRTTSLSTARSADMPCLVCAEASGHGNDVGSQRLRRLQQFRANAAHAISERQSLIMTQLHGGHWHTLQEDILVRW